MTDGPKPFKRLKPPKGLKPLDQFGIIAENIAEKNAELAAAVKNRSAARLSLSMIAPKKAHVERVQNRVRKERMTKEEALRQRDNRIINEEINRGGMTINLKRCFRTGYRVSADVYQEMRAREINRLQEIAHQAEESAKHRGSKTIQMQDVV